MCADWVNEGDMVYLFRKVLYVKFASIWLVVSVGAEKNIKHGVLGEKTNGLLLLQYVLYMYHYILFSG